MHLSKKHFAHWQNQKNFPLENISPALRDWILDAGSTTQRIQNAFGVKQQVNILKQAWDFPNASEAHILKIDMETQTLIREVELICRDQAWMFGRTVIPKDTLSGEVGERLAQQLDERPIGQILFQESSLKRDPFEIALLTPENIEYPDIIKPENFSKHYWARRSIFWIAAKPLLLTEIYLTDELFFAN